MARPQRSLSALLADARARLQDLPQERLGELRMPRGVKRALGAKPKIVPVSSAWRVGVLLVGSERMWATGTIIRAAEEVRRGFAATSQHERAIVRAAAFRGGFAQAEIAHVDWTAIDVAAVEHGADAHPLVWADGGLQVRWSPSGWTMPLETYLDEQVEFLLTPPRGAT